MQPSQVIIYISEANPGFGLADIEEMLYKAKQFNASTNITGFILYGNNRFIQLIEGDKGPINDLYARIRKDKRHTDVTTLWDQQNKDRLFRDWYMSFYDMSGGNTAGVNKRLLLENYLSRPIKDPPMQKTLRRLHAGIQQILNSHDTAVLLTEQHG